ncbi:MAG: hypothetical protein DRP12_02130 [Candidatus Aenigmatarchaeota archaeon]|nr:MAG: hypothetical protein DRP12_02130 [Candidatus Aenigmarchaeota archaeon]
MQVDLVVVGYLLHDIIEISGKRREALGGPAAYTSLAASLLGLKVGIVTKVGKDFKYWDQLDLPVRAGEQERTTCFLNIYQDGRRRQEVRWVGEKIGIKDFPEEWLSARFIHLGPVISEIDPKLVKWLSERAEGRIILDPQGFMREARDGRVEKTGLDFSLLDWVDLVKVSEDDLEDEAGFIRECEKRDKTLIITRGERGSEILWPFRQRIPAWKFPVRDPTGAGDVYVAGLVYGLLKGYSLEKSCRFASALASYSVSIQGPLHSLQGFDPEKIEAEL